MVARLQHDDSDIFEAHDALTMFKTEAKRFGSRFSSFITYFEEEWIKKVGPNLFCVFLKSHRTNNLVESYNSNIRSKIPPSGCFFRFVEFLQKEDLIKSEDYKIIKRKKYKERVEFISIAKKNSREISGSVLRTFSTPWTN